MLLNKSSRNVTSLFILLLLKDGDCVKQFNSDKEIKEYIEKGIDSIKVLDECRLYREEQLQITDEDELAIGRDKKFSDVCLLFGGCCV